MPEKRYSINSDRIVWRNIEEEAVILNLDSGYYYSLNELGTKIWQLLIKNKTTAEIISFVYKEYDINKNKIKKDLLKIINELKRENLIEDNEKS